MLTVDRAQALFDKLRKFSTADEIELLIFGGRSSLTRFANNTIHQNVAEVNAVISVRTVFAGRTARATTNKFDDESLRRVVESAEALSKVQHPDRDLLGFMFDDFGGMAILDQRSFLNDRVGKKIFGDNITIRDDVSHPLQSGAGFDGEGVTRQRVELVKNGVAQQLVYARATAEKMKKTESAAKVGKIAATGHGFPLPNEIGEAPMNIVVAPPASPQRVEQMIASTPRGVLVTRLWYIREVDPYEKILTGMTRDGTFLIEDG